MAVAAEGYEPLVTDDYVQSRFLLAQHGKPTDAELSLQAQIGLHYAELASLINSTIEDNRAKSLALTALEESIMWMGKAIFAPASTSQRSRG